MNTRTPNCRFQRHVIVDKYYFVLLSIYDSLAIIQSYETMVIKRWYALYILLSSHDVVIMCKHFSALLALCAENSPVTGEFPSQRPVTRGCDLHPNKRPNKQQRRKWFETPSNSLWRHCNVLTVGWRMNTDLSVAHMWHKTVFCDLAIVKKWHKVSQRWRQCQGSYLFT